MKLPNHEKALVPREKIVDYLLSPFHKYGGSKAAFFKRFGFTSEMWQVLAEALLKHALENEVSKMENTPFGMRYIIEGEIGTPDNRAPKLCVVWFIKTGSDAPCLVTAYPSKKRN